MSKNGKGIKIKGNETKRVMKKNERVSTDGASTNLHTSEEGRPPNDAGRSAMQIGVRYENEDKNEWMEGESSGMKHELGSCDSNDKWDSCRLRQGPGEEGTVQRRGRSGLAKGRARAVTAGGGAVVEGGAQVGPRWAWMMADFYRWRIYKWGEVARDLVGRLVEAEGTIRM
ncbi:hypothetical protein B0H14DRAFT_2646452 [Mycena olivaceomarginata]|nr:hypothetical protein B0H14DRAFT_2646452 [Mycena olivaceomarginata]